MDATIIWTIIGILVVGVVIYFLFLQKKGKKEDVPYSSPPTTPSSEDKPVNES